MTTPRAFTAIVLALPLAAFPISAATAGECARADASLAGRYYLGGVMEVGSELSLHANGRFDYMLAYGALDELAIGCWMREGDVVTLVPSEFKANMDDPAKFERLELKVTPEGKLLRQFGPRLVGKYSR